MGYQGSLRSPRSMRMRERREYVTKPRAFLGCFQKWILNFWAQIATMPTFKEFEAI
jgi:hypothetical protein